MTNLPITGTFKVTCIFGKKGSLWAFGYHKGIDLTCSNKKIYSTCDGTVKTVGWDPDGWGRYVRVEEKTTKQIHIFAHLVKDSVKVSVGQKVSRATVLGTMGTTGNSTGIHLHYQIEKNNTDRTVIDPTTWLKIPNKVGTYNSDDYQIKTETAPAKPTPTKPATPAPVKPKPAPTPTKPKKEEEEEMTQEQFNKMMDNYLAQLANQPADAWAKEDLAWAKKEGLINGDDKGNQMPRKFMTREELAAVLHRYDGKK